VDDLTMPARTASGFRVVAEAIVRRWQTPRGGLIDDPNYGFDLSDFLSDDIDTAGLNRIKNSAKAEALKDERVIGVDLNLTFISGVMMVTANVTTAAGPFKLVVSVSQVSTTLLQVTN
jgi:hypothetical protein